MIIHRDEMIEDLCAPRGTVGSVLQRARFQRHVNDCLIVRTTDDSASIEASSETQEYSSRLYYFGYITVLQAMERTYSRHTGTGLEDGAEAPKSNAKSIVRLFRKTTLASVPGAEV